MRLALSKKGLGPAIENEVWHYAFIAPSAKAIRGVILEDQSHPHAWTRKLIIPKAGAHVKAGMGRRVVALLDVRGGGVNRRHRLLRAVQIKACRQEGL